MLNMMYFTSTFLTMHAGLMMIRQSKFLTLVFVEMFMLLITTDYQKVVKFR